MTEETRVGYVVQGMWNDRAEWFDMSHTGAMFETLERAQDWRDGVLSNYSPTGRGVRLLERTRIVKRVQKDAVANPSTPWTGYDAGCDYCHHSNSAKAMGFCKRGKEHEYKQCGE